MVAISALTMMEGRLPAISRSHFELLFLVTCDSYPFYSIWRNVRGAGLAYGTSMDHDVFAGLIKLDIYRSSHPAAGAA